MTVNLVQTNLSALHIELNNTAGALDRAGNTNEAVSILFDFFTVINRYTRYRRCQMQGKSQNNSGGIYNFKMYSLLKYKSDMISQMQGKGPIDSSGICNFQIVFSVEK